MRSMALTGMFADFISLGFGLIGLLLVSLLGFAGAHWLNLSVGTIVDWLLGGAIFWWLLVIVTVPWNVHFRAKEVLAEAALSDEKQITVDHKQLNYAKMLAQRSLIVALVLHGLSAIGLYILSATGITPVGYISSGAALLLTGLRPAVEAYGYFLARLAMIRHTVKYPREDVVELRDRVMVLEDLTKRLEATLDPEKEFSWAATQQQALADLRRDMARLNANLEDLRATNQTEHDRLSREARQAIAQLSEDSRFLDQVREIIRFFKSA